MSIKVTGAFGLKGTLAVALPNDFYPDPFSFTNVNNRSFNSLTNSDIITISGVQGNVPVSATNGAELSINGGPWVNNGIILNGQTLQVRLLSSSNELTSTSTEVTVGMVLTTWTVTTRAFDVTPDNFTIPEFTNQSLNTLVNVDRTITGLDSNIPINVQFDSTTASTLQVDNGSGYVTYAINTAHVITTSTSGTLNIRMGYRTSSSSGGTASYTLTVGTISDSGSTTTTSFLISAMPNSPANSPVTISSGQVIRSYTLPSVNAAQAPNSAVLTMLTSGAEVDGNNNGVYAASESITRSGNNWTFRIRTPSNSPLRYSGSSYTMNARWSSPEATGTKNINFTLFTPANFSVAHWSGPGNDFTSTGQPLFINYTLPAPGDAIAFIRWFNVPGNFTISENYYSSQISFDGSSYSSWSSITVPATAGSSPAVYLKTVITQSRWDSTPSGGTLGSVDFEGLGTAAINFIKP